jgi:hypothetical protein
LREGEKLVGLASIAADEGAANGTENGAGEADEAGAPDEGAGVSED